ncbi:MAG: PEP-CTERM sorting domain-containing protein [Phycisphaerae bacterium]
MLRFAVPVAMVLAMACVEGASAATLYSNDFESGSAPEWVSPNADTTLSVVDDGSGNHVLDVNEAAATGGRPLVVPITSVTLADGDSVQLSFDVKMVTAAGSIPSADRSFRFALFNSKGTTSTSDDIGYIGRADTGTSATTTFDLSGNNPGTSGIFSVSGSAKHTSTSNTASVLNDNNVHTITVLLQRTGTDVFGSASFTNGATTVNIGPFDDTLSPTTQTYTFDELAIGYNNAATLEYTLDNVNVTGTTAVPEPASLGVLGLAGVGLLVRRRKA